MGPDLLSIDALERDLVSAERELTDATAARVRATEVENEWETEVKSLRNLILVRRKRLTGIEVARPESIPTLSDNSSVVREELASVNTDAAENGTNRVEWIAQAIDASGTTGISPPELMKKAESERLKMHPNYHYVALKKLVERGRAVKKEGRYFAKQVSPVIGNDLLK